MWLNQIQITEIILIWRCEKSVVGLDKFVSATFHVNNPLSMHPFLPITVNVGIRYSFNRAPVNTKYQLRHTQTSADR